MVIGLSDQELAAVQQPAMDAVEARRMTKHSSVEKRITWFSTWSWPKIVEAAKNGQSFIYLEIADADLTTHLELLGRKGFITAIKSQALQTTTILVTWYDE
jgi:hypothetical protein